MNIKESCIFLTFISDHVNKFSLEDIQRSILVLCLDQPLPDVKDPLSEYGGDMLHGSGSQVNSANRWFDKTLQVMRMSLNF